MRIPSLFPRMFTTLEAEALAKIALPMLGLALVLTLHHGARRS